MSMMPEDDDMGVLTTVMEEEETDISKLDFSHVSKHPYLSKVFCWIQSGNTQEVIHFFDTFPHLLSTFHSPNNWNPLLYAVRYGNLELIDYFAEKNSNIAITGILNTISIVHTAVYSGEPYILEYIFKKLPVCVNPPNCEISPLKAAIKATNTKMVQFLVSRGAFYVFGDVYNNLSLKENADDQHKYMLLGTNKEIPQSMVVEESTIRDCPIKEVLKYARIKNIMCMRKFSKKMISEGLGKNHKFQALASILSNDEYFNSIVKTAVNKGDSIMKKSSSNDHSD